MIWPFGYRRPLPIDLASWRWLESELPYLRSLGELEQSGLRGLIAAFLSSKTFSGMHGVEPDDSMRLTIAAQACLPILHLGLAPYRDFVEIVVYPSAFRVRRIVPDADGLVHEFDDVLAGEAMDGGPVVLSWDEIAGEDRDPNANVVIHEFVHKIDLADGDADGCPPLPPSRRDTWREVLESAYDQFVDAVERVEASIPPHIDPESREADPWYATLPLDAYAATDEAEFFAVAAECFFVDPSTLANAFPDLYGQFAGYFRQDPLARARAP